MKKLIALLLSCILLISHSFAQKHNGVIKGTVTSVDGKAAEAVSVLIKGKSKGTITNEKGYFEFRRLQPGVYTIIVTCTGCEQEEQEVTVTDQPVTVSFQLKATSKELSQVIVTGAQNRFAKKRSDYVARMPLSNIENPQVYNVVGKELLQEQMITSFDDAIKNAPGVERLWSSTGRAGDGAGYFSMRGFSVQPTMINGIAGQTNGGLDPANIERIETIKGPSGTLFGSSLISYGGLINIVTKKPYDSVGGEISYTAGSYDLNRLTVDFNTPLNKSNTALFRINGAYHYENSWQDAGFKRSFFLAPSFSFQANDRLSFLLNAEFYKSEGTNPLSVFMNRVRPLFARTPDELGMNWKRSFTSNDITIKNPTVNLYAQATYRINDKWISQTNLSRSSRKTDGLYSYVMFNMPKTDDTLIRYFSNQNGVGTTTDIQQNFIGDFTIGHMRNRIVAGFDFLRIETKNNSSTYINYDTLSSIDPLDPHYNQLSRSLVDAKLGQNASPTNTGTLSNTYSAYVSDVLNITEQLAAMLSVRVDHFDNRGSFNYATSTEPTKNSKYKQTTVSPKFGLSYQIIPEQLSVFGNYMNGFRNVAPVTQQLPEYSGTFDPQRATQYEGGVKLDLFRRKLSLTASYYEIEVEKMTRSIAVIQDQKIYQITIQDGNQKSKGFEADIVTNPIPGLNIIAGYSYNDARNLKTDSSVLDRRPNTAGPRHLGNAWISYTFIRGKLKGLGIGVGGNYGSENIVTNQKATGQFVVPSYTVFNASLFYNSHAFRIGVKMDNLTDELYWKGWSTIEPQMPRRISASVAYRF